MAGCSLLSFQSQSHFCSPLIFTFFFRNSSHYKQFASCLLYICTAWFAPIHVDVSVDFRTCVYVLLLLTLQFVIATSIYIYICVCVCVCVCVSKFELFTNIETFHTAIILCGTLTTNLRKRKKYPIKFRGRSQPDSPSIFAPVDTYSTGSTVDRRHVNLLHQNLQNWQHCDWSLLKWFWRKGLLFLPSKT